LRGLQDALGAFCVSVEIHFGSPFKGRSNGPADSAIARVFKDAAPLSSDRSAKDVGMATCICKAI